MDALDLFFKKYSYKFPKGYPDMDNPKDKEMLFEIVKKLTEEEKPKFNKQDLIDYINNLEDEEALNKILKFAKSTGFSKDSCTDTNAASWKTPSVFFIIELNNFIFLMSPWTNSI